MPTKKATTATLIRGSLYSLRHPDNTPQNPLEALRFERGVPKVIDDQRIVAILEDLTEETRDGDGEYYDKPIFRIDTNAQIEVENNYGRSGTRARPTKLEADRVVRKRPRSKAS